MEPSIYLRIFYEGLGGGNVGNFKEVWGGGGEKAREFHTTLHAQ